MSLSLKQLYFRYDATIAFFIACFLVILMSVSWFQRSKFIDALEFSQSLTETIVKVQLGVQKTVSGTLLLAQENSQLPSSTIKLNWQKTISPSAKKLKTLSRQLNSKDQQEVDNLLVSLKKLEMQQWWLEDVMTDNTNDIAAQLKKEQLSPLNNRLMHMMTALINGLKQIDEKPKTREQIALFSIFSDLRGFTEHYFADIQGQSHAEFDNNTKNRLLKQLNSLKALLKSSEELKGNMDSETKMLYTAYVNEHFEFTSLTETFLNLLTEETDIAKFWLNKTLKVSDEIERNIEEISNRNLDHLHRSQKKLSDETFYIQLWVFSICLALIILNFIYSRRIAHRIVAPIHATAQAIESLSKNKKTSIINRVGIQDVDTLVDAFYRLESSLQASKSNLDTSQTYLSNILQNIGESIVVADYQGKILLVNEAVFQTFGHSEKHLLGQNVSLLMPEDFKHSHPKHMTDASTDKDRFILGKTRNLFGQHKDGTKFPLAINLKAFSFHGTRYFVAAMKDISEQTSKSQELIRARLAAESADKAKSKFLADMSHDLRTPLNAILGFAQILQMDDKLSETGKEYTQHIYQAGEILLNMINEVLNFARIESGSLNFEKSEFDAADILNTCLTMSQNMATNKGINLSIKLPEKNQYTLYVDKTKTLQILFNLISNAIKYNRQDGWVKVTCTSTKDNRLRIEVEDNGFGIAEDKHDQIFSPFTRLHDQQREEIKGTGIGLAITQQLAVQMDGSIGFNSEVGTGSCFWLELPMTDSQGSGKEETNNTLLGNNIELDAMTLVYVDDDFSNRVLFKEIMEIQSQVSCHITDNTEEALALSLKLNPDVIITDIDMPERDGFWLKEQLDEKLKQKVPIIALSATATAEAIEKAIAVGFECYLTKPLDVRVLYKRIAESYEKYQHRL